MARAFDSVSWGYLLDLLQHTGFGHKWRDMLALLWESSTSRIITNGALRDSCTSAACGKEIICLRCFSRLPSLQLIGSLRRLRPKGCSLHLISHPPSFARVTMPLPSFTPLPITSWLQKLCCIASPRHRASAQICRKVHSSPSAVMKWTLQSMLASFPVQVSAFPCTYLGLPLHFRSITRADLHPMLDKIAAKLQRWRGKLLSHAERLVLINSVLTAVPIYLLSVFKLGRWALKKIDEMRRNFLWKSDPDYSHTSCLVSWKQFCRPKALDGLGVTDLQHFSRALWLRWVSLVGSGTPCDSADLAFFDASITTGDGTIPNFGTQDGLMVMPLATWL